MSNGFLDAVERAIAEKSPTFRSSGAEGAVRNYYSECFLAFSISANSAKQRVSIRLSGSDGSLNTNELDAVQFRIFLGEWMRDQAHLVADLAEMGAVVSHRQAYMFFLFRYRLAKAGWRVEWLFAENKSNEGPFPMSCARINHKTTAVTVHYYGGVEESMGLPSFLMRLLGDTKVMNAGGTVMSKKTAALLLERFFNEKTGWEFDEKHSQWWHPDKPFQVAPGSDESGGRLLSIWNRDTKHFVYLDPNKSALEGWYNKHCLSYTERVEIEINKFPSAWKKDDATKEWRSVGLAEDWVITVSTISSPQGEKVNCYCCRDKSTIPRYFHEFTEWLARVSSPPKDVIKIPPGPKFHSRFRSWVAARCTMSGLKKFTFVSKYLCQGENGSEKYDISPDTAEGGFYLIRVVIKGADGATIDEKALGPRNFARWVSKVEGDEEFVAARKCSLYNWLGEVDKFVGWSGPIPTFRQACEFRLWLLFAPLHGWSWDENSCLWNHDDISYGYDHDSRTFFSLVENGKEEGDTGIDDDITLVKIIEDVRARGYLISAEVEEMLKGPHTYERESPRTQEAGSTSVNTTTAIVPAVKMEATGTPSQEVVSLESGLKVPEQLLEIGATVYLHELIYFLKAVAKNIHDISIPRDELAKIFAKRASVVEHYFKESLAKIDHPELKGEIEKQVKKAIDQMADLAAKATQSVQPKETKRTVTTVVGATPAVVGGCGGVRSQAWAGD